MSSCEGWRLRVSWFSNRHFYTYLGSQFVFYGNGNWKASARGNSIRGQQAGKNRSAMPAVCCSVLTNKIILKGPGATNV